MSFEYARTISDAYDEYVDDELGYVYHASEVISASEASRLSEIRLADETQLDELESRLSPPSDLHRWALAQRRLQLGDPEAFTDHVHRLLEGEMTHPALNYLGIGILLARLYAREEHLDPARDVVDRIETVWPELSEELFELLEAKLWLWAGEPAEAHQRFDAVLREFEKPDVDLLFEIAQDFHHNGAPDHARRWLERARHAARQLDDTANLVDIELLQRRLDTSNNQRSPDDSKK